MKKYYINFLFILLLAGICTLPQQSEAATLRGIILGDTNDLLGDFIQSGISEMEQEMRTIAAYSDMDLEITVLKGNLFNSQKILETLENLKVDEEDTVFLFSFSHGYREKQTSTPWPSIHIKTDNWLGEGIDQLVLTEILQEKNPKLLISMFSCCNSYVEDWYKPNRVTRSLRFALSNAELVKKNYKHLFRETSGTIMMSSSTPGKYSLAYERFGEIFLSAFLDTLRTSSQNETLDWPSLFAKAHDKTGQISVAVGGWAYQYYPQLELLNFKG
jgi:hypothetical protein